ncbi:muramoyltetrapeptide carboxypeptidase, partial [Pseudomonas syringae pv. pisi str. 1704B]
PEKAAYVKDMPVLGGLPVGHGDLNQAVPLGTQAILD